MTKRVAALFALFAFAVAWLVGVWCGHSPLARLENAGIALVSGFVAGLGIGVALERIVLARLSEKWQETELASPAAAAPGAKAPPPAVAADGANAPAPAGAGANQDELEAVAAGGEAKR